MCGWICSTVGGRRAPAVGFDCCTIVFLLVYLGLLLYGGLSSTQYALEYGERAHSAWRPYMAPVKIIACVGIVLMLLQAFALLFRDVARLRGEEF